MASTYTSVVNIQGSSRRLYRGYVNATVSNINNTTSRISWTARVEMYNAYHYGVGVECSVGGTVRGSKTGYLSSNPGGSYQTVATTSGTTDYTRGTSAKSVTVTVRAYGITVSGYGSAGGSTSASVTVTIPALPSYTVAYNANGGSGAPGNQTKWYGQTLTLSSTKPSRTGHTFNRWSANLGSGNVYFNPGAAYTYNSSATLYANWTANTWTISYDANGGTGAPSAQTKTYGQTLVLSSTVPTRTNYNFLGWAISSTGSAVYQPGGNYTTDGAATLYAVWEVAYTYPVISKLTVDRCTSSGVVSDEGTYALVTFLWSVDSVYSGGGDHAVIGYRRGGMSYSDVTVSLSGMSGQINQIVGSGLLDTEYSYDIRVEVFDTKDSTEVTRVLPPLAYIIDFSPEGGVAIGKPAPNSQSLEVDVASTFDEPVYINSGIAFGYDTRVNIGNATVAKMTESQRIQLLNHTQIANGKWLQGGLSSGDFTDILRMSEDDRVELNWTSGGLKGRVMKQLWSGTWTSGSITVPEAPYYNVFMIKLRNTNNCLIASRTTVGGARIMGGSNGVYWQSNGQAYAFLFACAVNGTTLTLGSNSAGYVVTDQAGNRWITNDGVEEIYGLL